MKIFYNLKITCQLSFFTKLGKSFIRSAVNQVGRDGGRVVSNKLYGDRHAIKIQNINQESSHSGVSLRGSYTEYDVMDINDKYFEDRNPFITEGFEPKKSILGLGYILLLGVLVLIPILGQILWIWALYLIIKNINKTHLIGYYSVPVYKPDKRYKEGVRYIGDETKEVSVITKAIAGEKRVHIIELLFILIGIPLFWVTVAFLFGAFE